MNTSPVLIVIMLIANLVTVAAVSVQIWVLILNRRDMRSRQENLPISMKPRRLLDEEER